MPTLLLVDGSSYLYRAFHALPDLRTAAGQPTGAIRGVLSMLRVLEADYKSDYRAVVFDAKGKTFRDDWYPEYKAHRPSMPEDLAAQIAPLHECIRAAGWPLLMVDGVEADDVIGTLSRQATNAGIDCVISTGDKDLTQLVNPRVRLVNTMSNEVLDEAGVKAKFGVPPQRIIDYLALVGDTSDGIPGVPKVGPKTAVKWLEAWGSLDAIVAHANEIGGAVGENLRKHLDFLPLGIKLVTVVCDLPLPLSVSELVPQAPDKEKLAELYGRLEFKGWLRELNGEAPPPARPRIAVSAAPTFPAAPTVEPDRSAYECILDAAQLDVWLARLDAAALVSLDTETTDLDPLQARLVGISFAVMEGASSGANVRAAYLPLGHSYAGAPAQLPLTETLAKLKPWLESPQHGKLGQHLKYDRHVFANHGLRSPASSRTRCCNPMCWNRTRRTTSAPSPRAIAVWPPSATTPSPARAPRAFPSPRSMSRAPPNTPPRMPTSRCACIRYCGRSSRPNRNWKASTATWNCRSPKCCSASNATAY
jgi:DNA polymerase-1